MSRDDSNPFDEEDENPFPKKEDHDDERSMNLNDDQKMKKKKKKKKSLLKKSLVDVQRGVCYLSRIPPSMDHVRIRQIFSRHGEVERIYLVPKGDAAHHAHHKKSQQFERKTYHEGWVEFTKKSVAKEVAHMLNGEQIGGKKRSKVYHDLWNIKYLSEFKWDDLISEIAYKSAVRRQKLALEISAAKRECDFYISKVDQSHVITAIEERKKKKQKVEEEELKSMENQEVIKVLRQFPQSKPVANKVAQSKPQLSKDILLDIFAGS